VPAIFCFVCSDVSRLLLATWLAGGFRTTVSKWDLARYGSIIGRGILNSAFCLVAAAVSAVELMLLGGTGWPEGPSCMDKEERGVY